MAKEQEITLWQFDAKSFKEFFNRVKILKQLGIPDTRDARLLILHTMAHQKEIKRQYIKGETREEIEQQVREWAKKNIKKKE